MLEARQLRENSCGWMIHQLARRLDEHVRAELEPMGLNLSQFPIMMTVLELAPVTQAEIATRYDRPPYVISRAVDGLVEKGLVERRSHPTSRRAHEIHVSNAGYALAPRLFKMVQGLNREVLGPLSEQEKSALMSLLPRLLNF